MTSHNQRLRPDYHRQRARFHHWRDGLYEILIGIGLMGYALFMSNPPTQTLSAVLLAAWVIFIGVIAFRAASDRLKGQITYPRTGYVQIKLPEKPPLTPRRIGLALLIAPLAALFGMLAALALLAVIGGDNALILIAFMLAVPALTVGWRTGAIRFYMLGMGIVLIGALLPLSGINGHTRLIGLWVASGALTLLSGVFALWAYLRQHPIYDADGSDNGDF